MSSGLVLNRTQFARGDEETQRRGRFGTTDPRLTCVERVPHLFEQPAPMEKRLLSSQLRQISIRNIGGELERESGCVDESDLEAIFNR